MVAVGQWCSLRLHLDGIFKDNLGVAQSGEVVFTQPICMRTVCIQQGALNHESHDGNDDEADVLV